MGRPCSGSLWRVTKDGATLLGEPLEGKLLERVVENYRLAGNAAEDADDLAAAVADYQKALAHLPRSAPRSLRALLAGGAAAAAGGRHGTARVGGSGARPGMGRDRGTAGGKRAHQTITQTRRLPIVVWLVVVGFFVGGRHQTPVPAARATRKPRQHEAGYRLGSPPRTPTRSSRTHIPSHSFASA